MFLVETPGTHTLTPVCGDQALNLLVVKFYYCAFTLDTLYSSGLAILVTLGLAFLVASRARPDVPGKLQMVLEFLVGYVQGLVRETVAEDARFVVPLAATIGLYILVANWLTFFPLTGPFLPANADLNQTLAMALVVIVLVQGYSIRVLGMRGYLRRFTKPFGMNWGIRAAYIPLNIIEEIVKPITLSLRLFGNIFAGVLMVFLLTLLFGVAPYWSVPALVGLVAWKFFDVFFVGSIQAFIFMLLTIIYFGMAREGLEEELHGSQASTAGHAEQSTPRPQALAETGGRE
jgi:F-type H+-transporting ATPase subunit a